MKRVSILLIFCISLYAPTQFKTNPIGSSIYMRSNAGTGELILQNSIQSVPGFLYNNGKGRTGHREA